MASVLSRFSPEPAGVHGLDGRLPATNTDGVGKHLENVYAKLDVSTRTAAVHVAPRS